MSVQKTRHTISTSTLDSETKGPGDTVHLELQYYSSKTIVDVRFGASEWSMTFNDDGVIKPGESEGPRPPKWLPEAIAQVEPGLQVRR
ncbi:hypothetical protein SAMN05192561_11243 [Halopenitus malekzadehii]|uniref:Uncharacterized protein n=1 Tax=Halopenitus malekzadehii TaxID=1267564 RepID=A0A1H6JNR4_9EURY|nr:hypothetical protein [Halopenitus malekzadehii]SEH60830.1 hypothetical protein SAMN05192561_11243 [Halopenitus malekzadehii]